MKILLVRHGHSTSNEDGTFTGQLNAKLSSVGLSQAKLCSKYIVDNFSVNAFYSSDLARAIDTIKPASDALNKPIILDARLREVYGGEWEGKTPKELEKFFSVDYLAWKKDIGRVKATNGENFIEVGNRAMQALLEISKKERAKGSEIIVVSTHAGVIRSLECLIYGVPFENMASVSWVNNASVTILEFDGQSFTETERSIDHYLQSLSTKLTIF